MFRHLRRWASTWICAAALLSGMAAWSNVQAQQATTLRVVTFGGTLGTGFMKGVEGFDAANNVRVQVIEATSAQALNRVLARTGQEPEYDVVMMSPAAHYQGVKANIWEEITPKDVPNVADIIPSAYEDRKYVGWGTLAYGMMVNTDALRRANAPIPAKWADLWNPAYKGKVNVQDFANSYGQAFYEAVLHINNRNVDAAFKALKGLKTNISSFSFTPAEVDNLLLQGEAWISPTTNARANLLTMKGAPIRFIYPEDGAGAWLVYLDIPKGSPRRALAMKFVNHSLSPEVQAKLAASAQMGPVNTKVKLDPKAAQGLAYGEVSKRLRSIRWGDILGDHSNLTNRWMAEFQN